jgi:hypothetical protein
VLCTVKVYRSEIAGQEVKKEDKKKLKEKKRRRRDGCCSKFSDI